MSDVQHAKSASTSTFLTALVLNGVVFAVELVAFTILRPRFKAVYEPRTLTPIKTKRVNELSAGLLSWPLAVIKADYKDIQHVNGVDSYFFVRFIRLMCKIFLPIWLISWAVLMPVTSIKTSVPGHSGLDIFIFGNVANTKTDRYAAHVILACLFTVWILYNIKHEMSNFITTRQHYLISAERASSVQATTVLITGIPAKYLSEEALLQMYSHLPGGVKKIWLNRDLKELPDLYDRRAQATNKLESAENALLKTAIKLRNKKLKKEAKAAEKSGAAPNSESVVTEGRPLTHPSIEDPEGNVSLAEKLVPQDQRPSHRLPAGFMPFSLPLIGKKVDTIEWARDEIVATNELLAQGRAQIGSEAPGKELPHRPSSDVDGDSSESKADTKTHKNTVLSHEYPLLSSAFITFNQQIAAHIALNALSHHEPYRMAGRYADVAPDDVIWGNLGMNAYEQKVRMIISYAATAGLIIFWAIPVAFIGILSNIHGLCVTYSWLAWLCKLPSVVVGIIQGVLPAVLLAVLMMLLPIILRLLARFEGIPKRTGLELSLMSRYFIFQVVHSFLIVTISSGIVAALPGLAKNPGSAVSILAQNLPQASVFFLTYIILQGLSGTAAGFLQLVTLILYYVKLIILGSTPRSIYGLKYGARSVAWGTLYPTITLLVVIALAYSIIAPIINGLFFVAFALFYLMYKYLFLWVFEQPISSDTGGLFFPKAIKHIFVGLYIQQVCLAGLFFLTQDENKKQSALAEGVVMVILIVFTIFFQMMISDSYGPLIHSLPLSLTDRIGTTSLQDSKGSQDVADSEKVAIAADPEAQNATGRGKGKATSTDDDEPSPDEMKPREQIDYGFAHPAASRPQRTIWMANDTLGLAAEEVAAMKRRGIDVSTEDALMDAKGAVTIQGPPPDEESRA
jgi:hypothetical protein